MTSLLLWLLWIFLGRLSCICRPRSSSAGDGSLLSIGVDLMQRSAMFESELDLGAFFKTLFTILTWLSINPLILDSWVSWARVWIHILLKIDGSDPGSEVHYLISRFGECSVHWKSALLCLQHICWCSDSWYFPEKGVLDIVISNQKIFIFVKVKQVSSYSVPWSRWNFGLQ